MPKPWDRSMHGSSVEPLRTMRLLGFTPPAAGCIPYDAPMPSWHSPEFPGLHIFLCLFLFPWSPPSGSFENGCKGDTFLRQLQNFPRYCYCSGHRWGAPSTLLLWSQWALSVCLEDHLPPHSARGVGVGLLFLLLTVASF